MPLAGIVSSSTAFLLVLILVPKSGSVASAAETCYCYQRGAVDGEANKLTKTVALLVVGPIELKIKKTVSPPPASGHSSAVPTSSKPPPIPAAAPSPRAQTADKRGLSWRAKAWCGWGLAVATVIVVFVVRPETFLVQSRIDPLLTTEGDGEGDSPVHGNEHATMASVAAQAPTGSCETRREPRSRRMPRPQMQETRPETLIIDSNGGSRLDANSELFYCPMCIKAVPIVLKSSFGSCDHHAFCSNCVAKYVAVKLRENVALPVECPDCECEDGRLPMPMVRHETRRIDPAIVTNGNEDSPVDGNDVGDGMLFYCAKCMHVVPCACIRPSFTSCAHDFCSSCVAPPTSHLPGRLRGAAKMPRHLPPDLLPMDIVLFTEGNGDSPVNGDGDLLDCAICMETVPGTLKFSVNSCGHAFCSSCIARYIAAKLDDKVARIKCPHPGCEDGAVEPESCHGIIPPDLLDKWGFLLCELAVGAKRMYCPYRECSALLLADGEAEAAVITEAECPHCHRLFCAWCAVPWHDGFRCEEFQKLGQDERGREDLLLRRLVGREGWQRCPKCQMFVEKSEGCNYIKCRCGYSFCYRCASELSTQNHYCNKCKR